MSLRLVDKLRFKLSLLLLLIFPGFVSAEIKIGAIASLQGGAAEQGQSWLEGATLAIEELNKQGIPAKLIIEDDLTQSSKAVSAFHKLTKIDRVDALIGGTWDFLAEAIFPLAQRDKTFTISPSNPKEAYSNAAKNNPFALTNGLSIEAEHEVLNKFFYNYRQKSLGIVSIIVPFATHHVEMVEKTAQENQIKLSGKIELALEDPLTAFKLAAQRISKNSPDMIYIVADYNALDLFMTELKNINKTPIVITTQHLEGAFKLSKNNQDRYQNCYAIYPKIASEEFNVNFELRFDHKPYVFAAEGYDAAKFLVLSLNYSKSRDLSPDFIYNGLKGSYSYQSGRNSLVNDKAVMVKFINGKLKEVGLFQ